MNAETIIVAPEHLAATKTQAYLVKETLSEESLAISDMRPAMWLNMWAHVLGYKDWGHFQSKTQNGHSHCSNSLIITESNMEQLCSRLQNQFFNVFGDSYLRNALYCCATPSEQATFGETPCYTPPQTIHLALMPNVHQRFVTDHMFDNLRFRPNHMFRKKDLQTHVLKTAKELRQQIKAKGGTTDDIKKASADIYLKSGTTFETIFESCLKAGYIERVPPCLVDFNTFRLTSHAISTYMLQLTQDFGLEYVLWRTAATKLIEESGSEVGRLGNIDFAQAFGSGVTPESFVQQTIVSHEDNAEHIAVIDARLKKETGKSFIGTNHRFIHLSPRIVSQFKVDTKKVALSINVTAGQHQLTVPSYTINKPFINKCITSAISEQGVGMFIALPEDCQDLVIEYHWDVDQKQVRHTLSITLEKLAGNRIYDAYADIACPALNTVLTTMELIDYCASAEDFYTYHPRGLTLLKAVNKDGVLHMFDEVVLHPSDSTSCYYNLRY